MKYCECESDFAEVEKIFFSNILFIFIAVLIYFIFELENSTFVKFFSSLLFEMIAIKTRHKERITVE